jgi:hypothetical protein
MTKRKTFSIHSQFIFHADEALFIQNPDICTSQWRICHYLQRVTGIHHRGTSRIRGQKHTKILRRRLQISVTALYLCCGGIRFSQMLTSNCRHDSQVPRISRWITPSHRWPTTFCLEVIIHNRLTTHIEMSALLWNQKYTECKLARPTCVTHKHSTSAVLPTTNCAILTFV